jgi:hypothetical protein
VPQRVFWSVAPEPRDQVGDVRRATTGFLKGDVLGGLLNAPDENWVTSGRINCHPRPVGKPFFGLVVRSGTPPFFQIAAFLFFDLPSVFGHGAAFMTLDAGARACPDREDIAGQGTVAI